MRCWVFIVHAAAAIPDAEHDPFEGGSIRCDPTMGFRRTDVGRFDDQVTAVRHGVACVDGQVHQHLLDLDRIGIHPAQVIFESIFDGDHFWDGPLQQPMDLIDLIVETDGAFFTF